MFKYFCGSFRFFKHIYYILSYLIAIVGLFLALIGRHWTSHLLRSWLQVPIKNALIRLRYDCFVWNYSLYIFIFDVVIMMSFLNVKMSAHNSFILFFSWHFHIYILKCIARTFQWWFVFIRCFIIIVHYLELIFFINRLVICWNGINS